MHTVYFVTSNVGKVESLRNILASANIEIPIDMLSAEYPEDKSTNSLEKIAKEGALFCAQKFNKRVIVTDVGLFISALDSYPGINTAMEIKRTGVQGITELMRDKQDRSAKWRLSLGYASPDGTVKTFNAHTKGTIAPEPRGTHGFGFDSIVIPEGHSKTLAEEVTSTYRDAMSPFRQVVLEFAQWYESTYEVEPGSTS